MKHNHSFKKLTAALLALLMVLGLAACASATPNAEDATISQAAGAILLSVNPKVEVEYDRNGLVLEVEGRNDDGKNLVIDYDDYIGKATQEVLGELIHKIHAAGYFSDVAPGQEKNILIQVSAGSAIPTDSFLEGLESEVKAVVDSLQLTSSTVAAKETPSFISLEEAKALVLKHLGVSEATFTEVDTDLDDNEYELEVRAGDMEYEFEINATTGAIKEVDREYIDQDDDHDDDDDTPSWGNVIGMEKAKQIVRNHLGDANAWFEEAELDDGKYEFEVISKGMEYEYEIHATTGAILEAECDD